MSLASSSPRFARESASSSARGRAFSWGAERLCWRWGSPKVWVSASRRAAHTNTQEQMSVMGTFNEKVSLFSEPVGLNVYLQMQRTWSGGPRLEAGRRRGALNSSYIRPPARHTHIALQSSETHRGKVSLLRSSDRQQASPDSFSTLRNYNYDRLPDKWTTAWQKEMWITENKIHTSSRGTARNTLDCDILSTILTSQIDPIFSREISSYSHLSFREHL